MGLLMLRWVAQKIQAGRLERHAQNQIFQVVAGSKVPALFARVGWFPWLNCMAFGNAF